MASLRRIIGENLDATSPFEYVVERVFNLHNFTVEAKFASGDPLAYPASNNDAELVLQDDESGNGNYNTINGGLVKGAEAAPQAKVRVVDLDTQNIKIVWTPNSASGGTIETLTITFQS